MRQRFSPLTKPRGRKSRGLGAALVLLTTLLIAPFAAVAPVAAQTTVIEARDEPSVATPRGEQVLRLAGPADGPESLDPALARDLSTVFLVRQIFRGLTRLDRDLHPVPELADRIEISEDGLVYTFRIRSNATFQNGRPINADDVVFSITRAVDPLTAGGDVALLAGPTFLSDIAGFEALMRGEAKRLDGIKTLDASTVEIRLAAPRSTFLMKLASGPGSIVDPDDVAATSNWWQSPNGSGPFRLQRWTPDQELVLDRFDEYFAGASALEQIRFRLGSAALQSFNLYQSGDIDLDGAPIQAIDRVLSDSAGLRQEVTVSPLFNVDYIAFRTDLPPLDDVHVRRAIQLAFPREKIAQVTYDGYLEEPQGLIPTGMLGRDWPVAWPDQNVEAARAELALSRYGSAEDVPPIEIYTAGYSGAESLRDSLRASLGLTIDVIAVEWATFSVDLANRRYAAFELYWGADYPDPESMLSTLFRSGVADNYSGYSNPEFDRLLDEAAREPDVEVRAGLYARAQQMLVDDAVVIPLYYDVAYSLKKPYVHGVEFTPLGLLRLETIWLEH